MKKYILKIILATVFIFVVSCEKIVEGINENPNDIIVADVSPKLFLTETMLANVQLNCGHLNRISGMYSGQLVGFNSLYSNIYGYNLSTSESNGEWNALYIGVLTNTRHIINNSSNDLLVGIAKVVEGHAFGTAASLFGDIPYSESGNINIPNPNFDSQQDVYNQAIASLDAGIVSLSTANSVSLREDIYFGGNKDKWIAAAYTLKARFYLHMKDYPNALFAAQSGIGSSTGDMKYLPRGATTVTSGDKNLFYEILEGARSGDIGNNKDGVESYLLQLIASGSALSRNHSKTDETARRAYFTINSSGGSVNQGIVAQFEPQNMVTYFENQLIKAECAARATGASDGLPHLNTLRVWMNTGKIVNSTFRSLSYNYAAFDISDFQNGGIENTDGSTTDNAFLREVIEERYVSGFGMHMAYNDARRLRKSDGAIAVPFIMVGTTSNLRAERMPYSATELNSNINSPNEDPGIFVKTAVNQ